MKAGVLALATLVLGAVAVPQVHGQEPCTTRSIGIDTVGAHYGYPYIAPSVLGEANGQSFVTADTLITSITAWRHYGEANVVWPIKLWLTRCRPDGYPLLGEEGILLEGPSKVFIGDGARPVELRYDFDPPFALPGPGRYTFFMQGSCGYVSDLMCTQPRDDLDLWPDAYPDGQYWQSGRSAVCRLDGVNDGQFDVLNDLLFTIEFCHDTSTSARPKRWGEVKRAYRRGH